MKTSGQCLCGAIKYEVSGTPAHLCLCHCTQCRQGVGATPVAWATHHGTRSGCRSAGIAQNTKE